MTTTDGRSKLRNEGRQLIIPTQALILRFRIELQHTNPLVWREIEVPGTYSFWDLHVAIQDAMGWQDEHLHRFTIPHPRTRQARIFGIHNLHADCDDPPGWATQIAALFTWNNRVAIYEYDFGDGWRHAVLLAALTVPAAPRPPSPDHPTFPCGGSAYPHSSAGRCRMMIDQADHEIMSIRVIDHRRFGAGGSCTLRIRPGESRTTFCVFQFTVRGSCL